MSLRNFFSDSKTGEELSGALILRRLLFLLLLFGLMLFYLGPGFKQLTSPKGIEQAQIARELARSIEYFGLDLPPMISMNLRGASSPFFLKSPRKATCISALPLSAKT